MSVSMMNNDSLPTATTPRPADDTEVLSQRIPVQGETILEAPQGEIPNAGHMGGRPPWILMRGATASLAPSQILHQNLQWFRIQVGSPLLRGASRLCR